MVCEHGRIETAEDGATESRLPGDCSPFTLNVVLDDPDLLERRLFLRQEMIAFHPETLMLPWGAEKRSTDGGHDMGCSQPDR